MKARIRGVNSDGNAQFGFIADATVTITDDDGNHTHRTISGSDRKSRGTAIKKMWEDWKQMCQEDFGQFIFCVNEGTDFHN